ALRRRAYDDDGTGSTIDRAREGDGPGRAHRRPQTEVREVSAAGRGIAEPSDHARPVVLDGEDGRRDGGRLQEAVEGDRPRVAQAQPLGELREDTTDGCLITRAQDHAELSGLPDE